ncbi:endonuclease/exonuclease/phosphatase family protein [Mycobacterium sp. SMC-16]|uniref:endonuclease/exonuclease/phosphatase family protein n=1 Tax=Mycobacteriaceae TaxID=1762 RepID=UPI000F9172CB|nr:endonuclease/exonuclease/phosphatase family protein [Mycolicibacterium sp.]RUP28107.1 MAG: exonuclease III [Mycolicibacterium sp.]
MTTTIATLNIRHGGRKSGEAVATRLLGYDADVLVITEFRSNEVGLQLCTRLDASGYATSHPDTDPKQNSVLVASRRAIARSWPFSEQLGANHLWCAEIDGMAVCAVYMPQRSAKLPYWEALIAGARRGGIGLLIGDFNTGDNDLDKDPKGTKFIAPEMPGRLVACGYTDMWRSLHPKTREYSWYSRPGGNGFRLDYIFAASELAQQVGSCEFDHAPRISGESDHSGLVASLW